MTIGHLLNERADTTPARESLVYTDRKLLYSYQRLREGCDRVACGLLRIKTRPGDRVAIWASNHPEWLVLQLALAKVGAVLVPVSPSMELEELTRLLARTKARALVFEAEAAEALKDVLPEVGACPRGQLHARELPDLRSLVTLGEGRHRGMYHFKDLIDLAEGVSRYRLEQREDALSSESVALLGPDEAPYSHESLLGEARAEAHKTGLSPGDRILFAAPFSHPLAPKRGLLLALSAGATLVTMADVDRGRVEEAFATERCVLLGAADPPEGT